MARTKQTARRAYPTSFYPKKAIKRYDSSDDEDEDDSDNNNDSDDNLMEVEDDQDNEALEENKEDDQPNPPASGDYLGPPRKPLNAFYFFKVDEFDATRAAHPTLTLMEVIDVIGQKWGDLDEDKKAEYQEKYEKHNNLYQESLKPKVWKPPVLPKKEPLASSTAAVVNPVLNTSDSKPDPPKRPMSAFFLYKADMFLQVKQENPDAKVTEITKIISHNWMNIDQETKAAYEARNTEAKQKYEQDMKEYEEKYGRIEKKKRRSAKQANDVSEEEQQHSEQEEEKERVKSAKSSLGKVNAPAPPKRPLLAFFLFKEDTFQQVRKDNPDAKVTEITKIISHNWMNIDQETKAAYEAKQTELKQKYEQEMKEYEEKYGSIQKKTRPSAKQASDDSEEEQNSEQEEEKERAKPPKSSLGKVDAPAPPKRPLSAFFLFKEDTFQQVKQENPDAKVTEITKIIARNWMNIDQETKAAYEARTTEARKKYEQDIKEYEEKFGSIQKKKRRSAKQASDDSEDEEHSEEEKERAKPLKASLKKGKKA